MMATVTVPRLGPEDVLVWTTPRSSPLPRHCASWLDAVEQARAAAMPPADRAAFVQARALLRGALGALLELPPERVRLAAACACGRPHGQVRVDTGPSRTGQQLHVSITRSSPYAAVAVSRRAVGVDITSVAAVARAPLAEVTLGREEAAWWSAAGAPAWALARAWARKEAALKAVGTGLDVDPSTVDVRAHLATLELAHRSAIVRLVDLPTASDVAGAVAVVVAADRGRAHGQVRLGLRDGRSVLEGV